MFIDEMQDTAKYQIELIDKIFKSSIIQKIGDTNQAIYSGSTKAECDWQPAIGNIIRIANSKRFSNEIASAIKNIAIKPEVDLNGVKDRLIKPKLIVYEHPSEVLPKFAEIININKHKWIDQNEKRIVYKAIGWVHEIEDANKVAVKDYFKEYFRPNKNHGTTYCSILNYLIKQKKSEHKSIAMPVTDALINCFLQICSIAERNNEKDIFIRKDSMGNICQYSRSFTKRSLLRYLKEEFPNYYDDFMEFLAEYSIKIYNHKKCEKSKSCKHIDLLYPKCIINDVSKFIKNHFCEWFDLNVTKINDFLERDIEFLSKDLIQTDNCYIDEMYSDIKIQVGSIHSVKGETHTATILMETYFNMQYESQRISDFICGNYSQQQTNDQEKTLKTTYVALSRPTHLLCMAIHKKRSRCFNFSSEGNKCPKFNTKECNWEVITAKIAKQCNVL